MRFLVAALLVLGVAYAHHSPEHKLTYPGWVVGKTHLYDVMINMTSSVPGISPQVSKAVIKGELKIYAKTEKNLILQMHKVLVSDSLVSVESATEQVRLHPNNQLEEFLKTPMSIVLENGVVKSYTLSPRESLESQKIKRAILRNLEMYLEEEHLKDGFQKNWPITYNLTRSTPAGNYKSHYVVTSSPYPEFPKYLNVFNVSRTDDFEVIPYLAYKSHHNFVKQGCPEVCTKNHIENRFGAGCPIDQEPYQTPTKRSFVQHHNLKMLKSGVLILDSIRTTETHIADVYDQNMEIDITSFIKFSKATPERISDPTGQQVRTDLNDLSKEINEEEIEQLCKYPDSSAAMAEIKRLLNVVAEIVSKDELKEEKSKQIGEMLVTLQKALQILKEGDLRTLQRDIPNYDEMEHASIIEKVKRQIWIDLLPTIGTSDSITFIVHLITENMNLEHKYLSLWESKTILEDLPQNIHLPTEKTIADLSRLLELLKDRKTPGYAIFYSAAHLSVARVIRNLCSNTTVRSEESSNDINSFSYIPRNLRARSQEDSENEFRLNMARTCPKTAAKRFIDQLTNKLQTTDDKTKRVIYIEALARTGLEEVLPVLRPYVFGQAPSRSSSVKLTRSYSDYLKTVTIHALHNVVEQAPRAVQDILVPVFLNKTEPPKVRTSAFSVIIKTKPTLGLLQHIAEQSWFEPSIEVASHVMSTLDTYGNNTSPCYQLTASRIKKVIAQIKRVDPGQQRAKNILWNLWDEVRGFGIENKIEYTPSNESFIPNVLYGSFGYNADTLRDYFFQFAYNIQGLTSRNVYDALLRRLGLIVADDIPKDKERNIFPELEIVSRDPEPFRVTAYEKMFYSTSYYYFDGEETSHNELLEMIVDQFKHYITIDSEGNFNGHLVKTFIPSSYHAKTVGQFLSYPVEFEMKNPLLLSLKLKVKPIKLNTQSSGSSFEIQISPSAYHSTIYTQEILNLGDCKKVGVYHEQKAIVSYPVVITVSVEDNGKYSFGYKFPQLPRSIYTYRSEAGTHAGKNFLQPLPSSENKKTIETLPSMFVKPISFGIVGLPKFEGVIKSEDIQFGMEDIPRTSEEAAMMAIKHLRNAGWRRKSVDIRRIPDSIIWMLNTEVKFTVNYTKEFVSFPSSENDWSRGIKFDDDLKDGDTKTYAAEGQKIYHKLAKTLSHVKNILHMTVEHKIRNTVLNKADMRLQYYHTLGRFLHFVRFNASTSVLKDHAPVSVTADYIIGFIRRPNEFKYGESYGKQKALALGAISFSKSSPFFNPSVIAKVVFDYKPLSDYLHMDEHVDPKDFEPETHEECLNDIRKGKSMSIACVKAIREKSIYNHFKVHAVWDCEIPEYVKDISHKVDLAVKHALYGHMEVEKTHKPSTIFKHLRFETTYIDKMTDEPVVDIVVEKPWEIVKFHKVSVGPIVPISSIETLPESYISSQTNNSYPATCAMMDKYIRTYDLMSYRLPIDTPACSYVLTTHCTEQKKFAVVVDYNSEAPGTNKIHVYLGKDEIVLVPGSNMVHKFTYNGKEQVVRPLQPLMLNEEMLLTALVNIAEDQTSFIEINARKTGLKVRYDGVRVKVEVHPRYKGELCGLCSEFNGELVREFRGVDRCLYTNPYDFAKSSILNNCVDKRPVYRYMCNNDEVSYSWGKQEQSEHEIEHYEPTTKRNHVLSHGSKLCFSIKPVPVCEENAKPIRTESRELDFYCLPKSDKNARKLVIESKRRILGELEEQQIDESKTVEVAKMC